MKNYKFVEHTSNICPVYPETMVVYRTTSAATPVSHIHHPMRAGDLIWDDSDQHIGSILEYARHIPKVKHIVDENCIDTFDGYR